MHRQPISQRPVVLVVDYNQQLRVPIQETLRQTDFDVRIAEEDKALHEFLWQTHPDAIIVDIDGASDQCVQVCTHIRGLPQHVTTPILVVAQTDDTPTIDRAYAAGATDFVTQPINWALLPYRLRYMLYGAPTLSILAKTSQELLRAQRIARLGTWEWRPRMATMSWSNEAYAILGVSRHDVQPSLDTLLSFIPQREHAAFKHWCRCHWRGQGQTDLRQRLYNVDGHERVVLIQAERRVTSDGQVSLCGTFQDITERQHAADRIHQLAHYDWLTELSNRTSFREHLAQAVAQAKRRKEGLAILYLDLDDFKQINDTLGHTLGDQLIKLVANRLLGALRASDVVTPFDGTDSAEAARLGGDEFAVVMRGLPHDDPAAIVARRLCDTMASGFMLGAHEVFVTTSIGIALYPRDGEDVETLMKHAGTALNAAKRSGKNAYRFFDAAMNAHAEKRLGIARELRRAIERNEFFLVYQPQMSIRHGTVDGAEALLRWQSHAFGLVPPDQFIPVAEDTGLISPIGEWVLRVACHQATQWLSEGIVLPRVAVNISVFQFGQPDFVDLVARILDESGLPAPMLELEITESLLAQDADRAVGILGALKALGVQLSIDDFGTGYSSLSYLKRFPVDRLKIDRSFVIDIDTDPEDAAIASAILGMAASMNLKVVAEGVETESQLAVLQQHQCDEMQGYLLSRPLSAEDMTTWLNQQVLPSWLTSTSG